MKYNYSHTILQCVSFMRVGQALVKSNHPPTHLSTWDARGHGENWEAEESSVPGEESKRYRERWRVDLEAGCSERDGAAAGFEQGLPPCDRLPLVAVSRTGWRSRAEAGELARLLQPSRRRTRTLSVQPGETADSRRQNFLLWKTSSCAKVEKFKELPSPHHPLQPPSAHGQFCFTETFCPSWIIWN